MRGSAMYLNQTIGPSAIACLERAAAVRVLVLGDVMLDRYLRGAVDRISPEAPIPIFRCADEELRLGGAGSVAVMLRALGAAVQIVAAIGTDYDGGQLMRLLGEQEISAEHLCLQERPTTSKTRIVGFASTRHPQQMLRLDREDAGPLSAAHADTLKERALRLLPEADAVIISDYAKGVCLEGVVQPLLRRARELAIPTIVDPGRDGHYEKYRGSFCLTPNRIEAATAAVMTIESPQEALEAARRLLALESEHVLVKLDKQGIAWAARDNREQLFPAWPRDVYDVTGAGDMVAAMLAFALAAGLELPEAIPLANFAAGLEVERLGAQPITRETILQEIQRTLAAPQETRDKVLPLARLLTIVEHQRARGKQIVMTNGCFDLLHPGHVASLEFARRQGDCLIVAVNSDRSVRALKGEGRPIIDQNGRAEMIAALGCVDYVFIFDDISVAPVVDLIAPDVLVKGKHAAPSDVVGYSSVMDRGGRVAIFPARERYSTSAILERVQEQFACEVCSYPDPSGEPLQAP